MKRPITILLFTSIFSAAYSQDTIYKIDGNVVIAKVVEISTAKIKYQLINSDYTTVIEEAKNDIGYIAFRGGTKEYYNYNRIKNKTAPGVPDKEFLRNNIRINLLDFMFTNLTLSYEHVFGEQGKFSLKIPFSVGLNGTPNTGNYRSQFGNLYFAMNRMYASGLELNLYPLGQTRTNFYIGVSSMVGKFFYNYQEYIPGTYTYTNKQYEGLHLSVMMHFGMNATLSKHIGFNAKMAIGIKNEQTKTLDYSLLRFQPEVGFAYKF